jgi:hypothetical protein
MEEHERDCKFEPLPVWQVEVGLDLEPEPSFTTKKLRFDVRDSKERARYLDDAPEVKYACVRSYYWVCKFVATEAETVAALEECKAKMREFLLHLAGEVDGLKFKQGE